MGLMIATFKSPISTARQIALRFKCSITAISTAPVSSRVVLTGESVLRNRFRIVSASCLP